jgi:hypothetical protein
MEGLRQFIGSALVGGLLVLAPIYIAVLLLLKAMQSIESPAPSVDETASGVVPAVQVVFLVLVVALCFFVGVLVRTPPGPEDSRADRAGALRQDSGVLAFQENSRSRLQERARK